MVTGPVRTRIDILARRGRATLERMLGLAGAPHEQRPTHERLVEVVTELWEERAAIREYLAGKRRREAEGLALDDVADLVLR